MILGKWAAPLLRAHWYESIDRRLAQFGVKGRSHDIRNCNGTTVIITKLKFKYQIRYYPHLSLSSRDSHSLSLSRFSLRAKRPATLAGDFSQLRGPFQARPVPKSCSRRPISSLLIFAARKLKDWRLERREVSAAAATVAVDVSGHLTLVPKWVLILNQSKIIAASHRRYTKRVLDF